VLNPQFIFPFPGWPHHHHLIDVSAGMQQKSQETEVLNLERLSNHWFHSISFAFYFFSVFGFLVFVAGPNHLLGPLSPPPFCRLLSGQHGEVYRLVSRQEKEIIGGLIG